MKQRRTIHVVGETKEMESHGRNVVPRHMEVIMKSRISHTIARIAALSLSLAVATPAFAQVSLTPVKVVSAAAKANARADTLQQRAEDMLSHKPAWGEAAKLYLHAAELRRDDPRAAEGYRMSAWLNSAEARNTSARKLLVKAAERSAATGDPLRAAHTYIDAAFAAVEDGRTDLVAGLLKKARTLADAEAITAEQQLDILRRLPQSSLASR